jgi:hypothetical protein
LSITVLDCESGGEGVARILPTASWIHVSAKCVVLVSFIKNLHL